MVAPPRVRIRIALAVVAVATVAVGCTPGGSVSLVTAPPKPAVTGVPDTGPITLTIWDQESGQVGKVWDQLNAEFEQKLPERDDQADQPRLRRAEDAPRVSRCRDPTGPTSSRRTRGGPTWVTSSSRGCSCRWTTTPRRTDGDDRVSPNVLRVSSWSPDGKEFGTGNLYGYTTMGEIVGVYYNKQMLADLGLTVPTTFDDFEQDLAVAKQAGRGADPVRQQRRVPRDPRVRRDPGPDGADVLPDRPDLRHADARRSRSTRPRTPRPRRPCRTGRTTGYFTPGFGGGGYDDCGRRTSRRARACS